MVRRGSVASHSLQSVSMSIIIVDVVAAITLHTGMSGSDVAETLLSLGMLVDHEER